MRTIAEAVSDDQPSVEERERSVRARAPAPPSPSRSERIVELPQREDHKDEDRRSGQNGGGEKPRKDLLRRHPFATLIAVVLLTMGAPSTYVYWDYGRHFQTTDDAFIETRQFAIAPKVAGYIIAVPVTDNQHVAADDVIARIDDRDYRIALEQAQVAGAEDGIQNIEAQMSVQQAQVNASAAQVDQAHAALTFAEQQAARYDDLARKGAGTDRTPSNCRSGLSCRRAGPTRLRRAFARIAGEVEKNCPVSKVLNATITLDAKLVP
jgi:membrane fusion protein (multidrug efflux system)